MDGEGEWPWKRFRSDDTGVGLMASVRCPALSTIPKERGRAKEKDVCVVGMGGGWWGKSEWGWRIDLGGREGGQGNSDGVQLIRGSD